MSMYIIDRSETYSKQPDFSGWENDEIESMCDSIYHRRMADAADNYAGLTWFPETGEIGKESDEIPDLDTYGIREWFEETGNEISLQIITMDADEIRAAYNAL